MTNKPTKLKNVSLTTFLYFVISISNTLLVYSQVDNGSIIPLDRRISWEPGIPGGIPYYPVGVNVTDYGATGDGVTDDSQAFIDAVEACPDSQAVLIPAGTYLITDRINIRKPIVLRGEGPNQTYLRFERLPDAADHQRTNIWIGYSPTGFSTSVISGCNKGSNQISVSDVSGFNVDDLVVIRQDNDSTVMARPIVPPEDNNSWAEGHWGWRAVGQYLIITDIDEINNTLTFHKPLYYSYNLNMNPEITRFTDPTRNAGVEDLHMELIIDCNGYYGNVMLDNAVYCWVKNIYSNKCSRSHIGIWGGLGNVIRDSYFEYSHGYAGGQGYGVNLIDRSTDNLIENNIFDYLQGKMMTAVGVSGNVYGYNYGRRTLDDLGDWEDMHADMSAHGHHAYMNLFEGNSVNRASLDSYWGSNSNYILLRNSIICPDGYVRSSVPAQIQKNNPYMSFVGNVLHHENPVNNTIVWDLPDEPDDFTDTNLTLSTLIRHGNYDCISENTFWEPGITDHNIPNSYYLNEKPDFFINAPWGNTPWPLIGPDLLHAGIIPAQQRFCDINEITPPQAPSDLIADVSLDNITLFWSDNSDNEQGFRIEQSTDGTNFTKIAVTMPDSTNYIIVGLEPYTTYYYRVCSYIDEPGNSLFSNIVTATTQEETPEELVAWYKFDGNAADSSDNNYDGIVNGATLYTNTSFQAYEFDGIDDNISVPTWDNPLNGDEQAFSITAWISPDEVIGNSWVISDDSQWGNFVFGLVEDKPYVQYMCHLQEGGYFRYHLKSVETAKVSANNFSFIAVTYDPINNIVRLYLNGELAAIDRISKPLGATGFDALYIGYGANQGEFEFFDGIIDDLRIYKSYLSGDDIYAIYIEGIQFYPHVSTIQESVNATTANIISVYPNPANANIRIESQILSSASFELYNLSGMKVLQQNITANMQIINISACPEGIYVYKIFNNTNQFEYGKFIIKR